MHSKYRMGFDGWALLLFAALMLPTILWTVFPVPHDVLRNPSAVPWLDTIGTVCQVVFLFLLCAVRYSEEQENRSKGFLIGCILFGLIYAVGWVLYYAGLVNGAVILLLTLPPCLCFAFYALYWHCYVALVPIGIFTVCHLLSACMTHF